MVAHKDVDSGGHEKTSSWLRKTQSGYGRFRTLTFAIGMIMLIAIVGGVGAAYYFGHQGGSSSTSITTPVAIGGGASESMVSSVPTVSSSTKKHTTELRRRTEAYEDELYTPTPTPTPTPAPTRRGIVDRHRRARNRAARS